MPAARRLIIPERSISRWLASSASAGASLRVERKKRDTRIGRGPLAAKPWILMYFASAGRDLLQRERGAIPALDRHRLREQRLRFVVPAQRVQRLGPAAIRRGIRGVD